MCAVREGSDETDFAPCDYVQRQRLVYHRLLGQNETGSKRYVRQTGGNGRGEGESSGLVGRDECQPGYDLDPCSARAFNHQQFTFVNQYKHIRRRHIWLSVFGFIL